MKRTILLLIAIQIVSVAISMVAQRDSNFAVGLDILCSALVLLHYCNDRWWFKKCPHCGHRTVTRSLVGDGLRYLIYNAECDTCKALFQIKTDKETNETSTN